VVSASLMKLCSAQSNWRQAMASGLRRTNSGGRRVCSIVLFNGNKIVRLPEMIERRRQWRRRYRGLFADVSGVELFGAPDGVDDPINHDNFWLTSIIVDSDVTGWSTEDLRVYLEGLQIESRPLWKPMHLQPLFAHLPTYANGTSERLFRTGLSLPSGSALSHEQFERVTDAVLEFVKAAA
jgi:dTDP-4-amino-4,6-dideoxygalactose transaminase